MAQHWNVIGGGAKGGIMVREDRELKSKEVPERLKTGSVIEELALEKDRLHYKLISGEGPESGWVSIKISGASLCEKVAHDGAIEPPVARIEFESPNKDTPGWDKVVARCEQELKRKPLEWKPIDNQLVIDNHERDAPGMFYGLKFPWSEATLAKKGAAWLTSAMHAAGTLDKSNKVTKVILESDTKVTTGNNGGKFLFEVEYKDPSPELHTKLFAKVPHPYGGVTMSDRLSSSVSKQPAEFYEINTYRLLESKLPMKTPKFYYGDVSNETSNFIIITERVAFKDFDCNNFGAPTGEKKGPLPAFEIEGPYDKCIDYNLRGDEAEYYACLVKTGARMAGMSQTGGYCPPEILAKSFQFFPDPNNVAAWGLSPWPKGPSGKPPKQFNMELTMALNFFSDTGKVLFPPYVQTPAFKKKFTDTMLTISAYVAEITFWKHKDLAYCGLGHQNLNVDNAFYWRDADGKLDCGIFDWGGMGSGSMGHKLWWWLYCRDFEPFRDNLSRDLALFIAEFQGAGGARLDVAKLETMVLLAAMEQMMGLISAVPQIYRMCSKKKWPEIKDRYDPRIGTNVDNKSTIRLYLHVMNSVIRIIEEMNGDQVVQKWVSNVYVAELKQKTKPMSLIRGE